MLRWISLSVAASHCQCLHMQHALSERPLHDVTKCHMKLGRSRRRTSSQRWKRCHVSSSCTLRVCDLRQKQLIAVSILRLVSMFTGEDQLHNRRPWPLHKAALTSSYVTICVVVGAEVLKLFPCTADCKCNQWLCCQQPSCSFMELPKPSTANIGQLRNEVYVAALQSLKAFLMTWRDLWGWLRLRSG